jgi:hypothetical protein
VWWIDVDDAVCLRPGWLPARLGSRRGAKLAQEMAGHLRAKVNWSGVNAWETVAIELLVGRR